MQVQVVFDMDGRWEARLCKDEKGVHLLEVGVSFYEFHREPNETWFVAGLLAIQEYRLEAWNDKSVYLVHLAAKPREQGETNVWLFPTLQGYDVGLTSRNRFFLSDPLLGTDNLNKLNLSYLYPQMSTDQAREIVQTVIDDLGLSLTLR